MDLNLEDMKSQLEDVKCQLKEIRIDLFDNYDETHEVLAMMAIDLALKALDPNLSVQARVTVVLRQIGWIADFLCEGLDGHEDAIYRLASAIRDLAHKPGLHAD